MQLSEVLKAVEQMPPEEMRQVREFIERREQQTLPDGTMDIEGLLEALAEMRVGLSEEEFAEIAQAMNEEYIEPLDEDE